MQQSSADPETTNASQQGFTWRPAKNRHCAGMTQQSETKARAGAAIVPVTLFEQNCTLIWCEATRKAVVIDPGGDVPEIQAAIQQTKVAVEKIWLTAISIMSAAPPSCAMHSMCRS